MKTYTKTHSSKKIAEIHLARIKKRGGVATTKEVGGNIEIRYHFPEKATKKAAKGPTKRTVRYDILSPDGITIRMGDHELFGNYQEARDYFDRWKKRFEQQGY